ncbi:MAG: ABC transporter ATP-binding protein [Chloroflexota bacterium]|nr:ABC transporter ATP-binding protein [Chloroflexota bacterium]
MAEPILVSVENVGYVFRSERVGVTALRGMSFQVRKGEFVSVLGPSGCGKTTLLRMIDGLIKPTEGRILIGGKEVVSPGPDRAMVFQDSGLMPWRTALQNVEMGLEFWGGSRRERREIARAMTVRVELTGFEDYYPHQLSGGMRQRIGLARALAASPDLYLMDEPFGSLDAQTRELMQEELLKLWAGFGKTVVFVTHSIDEAIYLSDRVIICSARPGRVCLEMNVPLSRPRWNTNVRASKEFSELREQAWGVLRQLIMDARGRASGSVAPTD